VPSLERLHAAGFEIQLVVTQPDRPQGRGMTLTAPPVKQSALKLGLAVIQPEKIKKNEEFRAQLESLRPDAIIVVGYGRIIPPWMLQLPRYGNINVHASLLPKYRGAAPVQWAIAQGEIVSGVTTMLLNEGLDTGDILQQKEMAIGPEDTAVTYAPRLAEMGADLIVETLRGLEDKTVAPIPQDHAKATLAPILKKEDGLADFTRTATEIHNRLRGFQPWPGCHTLLGGHRLIVWRAHASNEALAATESTSEPATIIGMNKTGVIVACGGSTALHIEELQIEGKRRLPAREVANGLRLTAGQRISDG